MVEHKMYIRHFLLLMANIRKRAGKSILSLSGDHDNDATFWKIRSWVDGLHFVFS